MTGNTARAAWESAALRLFEDTYSLVATGPRVHPDWLLDAVAVMNRDFIDPRGWSVLDRDRDNADEIARHGPAFPFDAPSTELLNESLTQITCDTAPVLLAAMTDDWCDLRSAPGFPDRAESLIADAHTLLARYGQQFECYTNADDVETTPAPDLGCKVSCWSALTRYTADYGLVVVSDAEVGIFWSFNPI
ncbi:hypothetical protein OG883_02490 [Streptomyces sp. NBC_01142]|uniref:hypothetical protein n=1 Tax=Streptomyces sp. NBC_01142 TaxID=2975865 RepID=UPI0022524753|nr:hypothetical protein [Streptomyces sp. NBC_01142]MCX4818786.1 hypothetical protein [Streptomyces sp. NBC_01142]